MPRFPWFRSRTGAARACATLSAVLAAGCAQTPVPDSTTVSIATTGKLRQVGFFASLNADCSLDAYPTVTIAQPPRHGTAAVETTADFPNFPAGSQRFECGKKRAQGRSVTYAASAGYAGEDSIVLDVIWPTSRSTRVLYQINVGQTAAEQGATDQVVTRTVASGQEQRLDYEYSINPDCTPVGEVQGHVAVPPGHGSLRIAAADIYTDFPKSNPRYDCNRKKSPGLAIQYQSAAGFRGVDSARIDILYPNQSIKQVVYEITVR